MADHLARKTSLAALAGRARAEEAAGRLRVALAMAGLDRLAGLVVTGGTGPGPATIELVAMRSEEARELVAVVERSRLAGNG